MSEAGTRALQGNTPHQGISAERLIADGDAIQECRAVLAAEFGSAVTLPDTADYPARLVLLGGNLTAQAVTTAMATTGVDRAALVDKVVNAMPSNMWPERDARAQRFGVLPSRMSASGRYGMVTLELGNNNQHFWDRLAVTKVFEDVLGTGLYLGRFQRSVAIASLQDPTVMKSIEAFQLPRKLPLQLGRLSLSYHDGKQDQRYTG